MEKREIIALLEALCDRPLAAGPQEPADLQAFCRDAVEALAPGGDAGRGAVDPDQLTAALAAVLSGTDSDDARRIVEEAVLRSPAARLDAQSAFAFVDAMEESPRAAPAELVEELLAADRAAAARSAAAPAARAGLWSRIAGASWSTRGWRLAAACAVLLIGGTASWMAFAPQSQPDQAAPPVAKAADEAPAVAAGAPPAPPAAVATTSPCEPGVQASGAAPARGDVSAASQSPAGPAADAACASDPHLADRPADEFERLLARQRLEAAREAAERDAAARAAATQADPAGPSFGTLGDHRPAAAARSVPAIAPTAPAIRPAAPYGVR